MDKLHDGGWPFPAQEISEGQQPDLNTIWLVSMDGQPKVWTSSKQDLALYILASIDACKSENCEPSILQQEYITKALSEEKPLTINLHRSVRSWVPLLMTSELAHTIRIERIPTIPASFLEKNDKEE